MNSLANLIYFKTTAETENITKAAQILNITQPALSHSLKQLQEEVGCSLFNYRGRGIELNTYGKIYLEHVNLALKTLEEGANKIKSLVSPTSGTVRISCLYSMGTNLLPFIIRDFKKEYPDFNFVLYQYASADQIKKLEDDVIDLCFCTQFDDSGTKNIEATTVMIEDLYILVNKEHRLAKMREVPLSELEGENFISYSDLTYFKRELNKVFERMNIHPNFIIEAHDDGTVAGLVAAGLGVAVIPPVFNVDFSKCVAIKISYPICQRTLCMAWSSNLSEKPAVKTFRDYVIKWLPINKKYIAPANLYPQ